MDQQDQGDKKKKDSKEEEESNEYSNTNLFHLVVLDLLNDHKEKCSLGDKCKSCILEADSIQTWDNNHRYVHTFYHICRPA